MLWHFLGDGEQFFRIDCEVVLQVDDVPTVFYHRFEHRILGIRQTNFQECDLAFELKCQKFLGHLVIGIVNHCHFGNALSDERLHGIQGQVSEDIDRIHDRTHAIRDIRDGVRRNSSQR